MKKALALALGAMLIASISLHAEEKKEHKKMTPEQKQLMKDITAKYDSDKDGKLSKEERAKMSDEDKQKCKDAGLGGHHDKKK